MKKTFLIAAMSLLTIVACAQEMKNEKFSALIPAGTIVSYAGKSIPAGWEICDGREVSKSDAKYATLFTAIGNIWGGTGNPNFRLPDLRDKFLKSVVSTNDVSLTGGTETHSHVGTTGNAGGDHYGIRDGGQDPPAATGMSHQHSFSTNAASNIPPFVKVVYLIKL